MLGRLTRRPLPFCVVLASVAGGCSPSEPGVVLYVSADDHIARQVVGAFERETGIRVATVGDTEQTKTTGLANRLRAERDNPQADVFWSSGRTSHARRPIGPAASVIRSTGGTASRPGPG
ncbi:MAG: hypothetical protein ACYTGF_17245 [Planctomycetota bacterium]